MDSLALSLSRYISNYFDGNLAERSTAGNKMAAICVQCTVDTWLSSNRFCSFTGVPFYKNTVDTSEF